MIIARPHRWIDVAGPAAWRTANPPSGSFVAERVFGDRTSLLCVFGGGGFGVAGGTKPEAVWGACDEARIFLAFDRVAVLRYAHNANLDLGYPRAV
jgi:hypothetical protein